MERKKKEKITKEQKIAAINKVFYKIKMVIGTPSILLYPAFFLKALGSIIQSHIMDDLENSSFKISKFLRHMTCCSNSSINCINNTNYGIICSFLYIFLLIPFFLFYIIYNIELKKKTEYKKLHNILIKVEAIIIYIIIGFSQHLIEYFSFVIISKIYQNNDDTKEIISIFFNNLYVLPCFFIILNGFFIIVLNVFTFYFIAFLNRPFFSESYTIQIYQNKWFKIFLVLTFDLQAIQLLNIFSAKEDSTQIFPVLILLFIIFGTFVTYSKNYFSEQTILSKIYIIICYMCFISCILEFYIYYHINKSRKMTKKELYEKLLFELIMSFVIYKISYIIKNKHYKREINKMLFNPQKRMYIDPYLYFATHLMQSVSDNEKLQKIIILIYKHKVKCLDKKCNCHMIKDELNFNTLPIFSMKNKNILNTKEFYSLYRDIVILIENEIYSLLHTIKKNNKFIIYCQILILHVEYLFFFSNSISYGCYLIEKYIRKCGKDIPFFLRFQLYQLKRLYLKKYKKNLKEEILLQNEQTKNLLKFSSFLQYRSLIDGIHNDLLSSTLNLINVIYLKDLKTYMNKIEKEAMEQKSNSQNIISRSSYSQLHLEYIIKVCKRFKTSHENLVNNIIINFSKEHKCSNMELCYLLNIYFKTICQNIPDKIIFLINKEYNSLNSITKKNVSFTEKGMIHPLIATLRDKKNFIITYCCKYLKLDLGYKSNELIGENINILLPSLLKTYHEHVLFSFAFIDIHNNKFTNKDKFILNKNGYCHPINIKGTIIPKLSKNISIISDITFLEFSKDCCFFVMDEFGNFLTYSQSMEDKFIINKDIIQKIKFNFFTYFNISENHFKIFRKQINSISKSHKFQSIKKMQRHSFKNIGLNIEKDKRIRETSYFNFLYDKRKLTPSLEKIKNFILESQSELYLLYKIEEFENNINQNKKFSSSKVLGTIINRDTEFNQNSNLIQFKIRALSLDGFIYFKVMLNDINHNEINSDSSISRLNIITTNKNNETPQLIITKTMANKSFKKHITMQPPPSLINLKKTASMGGALKKNRINSSYLSTENIVNLSTSNNNLLSGVMTSDNNNLTLPKIKTKKDNSFIKKNVKLNSTRKKNFLSNQIDFNFNKNILYIILFTCILFVLLFLSIFFHPLSKKIIKDTDDFNNLSFSIATLKYNVLLSSSMFFDRILLFHSDKIEYESLLLNMEEFDLLISSKAKDMIIQDNLFFQYLNNLEIKGVSQLISEKDTYTALKNNWNIYIRDSSIHEEILYYYYIIDYVSRNSLPSNCHIKNFEKELFPNKTIEVTLDDTLFYFITHNVLTVLLPRFDFVLREIVKNIYQNYDYIENFNYFYTSIFLLTCVIIIISFLFIFNHFIKSNFYMTFLLLGDKDDKLLTSQLNVFLGILTDFSYDKCKEYEKILNSQLYRRGSQGIIIFEDEEKNLLKTSTPSFINNSYESFNISSSKILKGGMDRKLSKKEKEDKEKLEIEEKENLEYNVIEYLRKNFKLIVVFKILISILMIIITILLINFLLINMSEIKTIKQANSLGIDYTNKLLYYIQLILTYKKTILNCDVQENETFNKNNYPFMTMDNYYKIDINLNSHYYEKFDKTPFGLTIYLLQLTLENLEKFNAEGINNPPLTKLKKVNDLYNQKDFCVTVNDHFYNMYFPDRDYIDHFKDIISSVNRCMTIGNGINKGGLKTSLESMFNELIQYYEEYFIDLKNNNTNIIQDYLYKPNILNLFINFDYPIDKAQMVFIKLIEIENKEIFKHWNVIENNFIYAFLSFDLLVVLVAFFIMKKLGTYYLILYDTVHRLHTALKIK